MLKERCNMHQQTLNFTAEVRPAVSLAERMKVMGRVANQWLDTKSEFYSRIASFTVTRRVAIRVNLVTAAMIVTIIAIETQPVAALTAALSVAWIMYRAMIGKEGGEL